MTIESIAPESNAPGRIGGLTIVAAAFAWVGLAAAVLAADQPSTPAQSSTVVRQTYRITGLFAPYRAGDLRAALEQVPEFKLVGLDYERARGKFEYEIVTLMKEKPPKQGFTPEQIVTRLDGLVRQATNHTFGVKLLSGASWEKLTRVEIPVAGLDCQGCCLAAYEAVAKIDGVEQATADFKDGLVTARFDPAKTDQGMLEAGLKKARVQVGAPAPTK